MTHPDTNPDRPADLDDIEDLAGEAVRDADEAEAADFGEAAASEDGDIPAAQDEP